MRLRLALCVFIFFSVATNVAAQVAPTWRWAQQIGSPEVEFPTAVATDGAGNTIATGVFTGTIQVGTFRLVCPIGSYRNLYVIKYDPQGVVLWARQAGDAGPGTGYGATSSSITTDGAGNVYVAGNYTGTLTVGNITLNGFSYTIAGFVIKYSAAGNPLWSRSVSGNGGCDVPAVGVDGNGNVFIGGRYHNTISFGTISLTSRSSQDDDVFLAKYTAQGVIQWARTFGGSSNDELRAVQPDAQGNIYVSGEFGAFITFDAQSVVSNGQSDVYLAKYNTQGTCLWANSYGGPGTEYSSAVTTDAAGSVYVAGQFTNTAVFSPNSSLVSRGNTDGFLLKCDGTGGLVWVQQLGGAGLDGFSVLTVSSAGNLYAGGVFEGSITAGTQNLVSAGALDAVLLRLDSSGGVVWAVRGGGAGDNYLNGVSYAGNGTVAMTVSIDSNAQFGPFALTCRGQADAIVLQIQDNTPLNTRSLISASWQAYPNPFTNVLTLNAPQLTSPAEVNLSDANGKSILRQNISPIAGQQNYVLPLAADIAPGIYWMQVKIAGRATETRQLLKMP